MAIHTNCVAYEGIREIMSEEKQKALECVGDLPRKPGLSLVLNLDGRKNAILSLPDNPITASSIEFFFSALFFSYRIENTSCFVYPKNLYYSVQSIGGRLLTCFLDSSTSR